MPLPTHGRGNSQGNEMLSVSNMTSALIKRGDWDADTAQGNSRDHEGRDWGWFCKPESTRLPANQERPGPGPGTRSP